MDLILANLFVVLLIFAVVTLFCGFIGPGLALLVLSISSAIASNFVS